MTRTRDNFTFNGQELTILYENLSFSLRHLTDDFTDEHMVKLYRKEIDLLEQITETL
jgi:hypothetical protein